VSIAKFSSAGPVAEGAPPTSRILFEHNVFERFGGESDFGKGEAGIMFQVAGQDLTFRHNTSWNGYNLMSLPNPGVDNLVLVDNLVTPGSYGIHPDGKGGGWNGGQETHIRGQSRMAGNAIILEGSERAKQTPKAAFPKTNLWLDSFEAAGVDPRTYRLKPGSKAKGTATDGTDPGADIDAVMKATAGVRSQRP
jgi:hypothetical protein